MEHLSKKMMFVKEDGNFMEETIPDVFMENICDNVMKEQVIKEEGIIEYNGIK